MSRGLLDPVLLDARSGVSRKWHANVARRTFLIRTGQIAGIALAPAPAWCHAASTATKTSIGEAFDREMTAFMSPRAVPGGSLAVIKNGRLVYARGYGLADREKGEPVRADSLFRIASISKPFTAVAIFRLIQTGRLELEAPAFEFLKLKPLSGQESEADPRLKEITIRHLLHHTAGWDRDQSGDPMFRSKEIARAAGVSAPANQEAIIRYMLGRKLDFDPGSRYAYSNFGYCVLGRVIEKASGMDYDRFVREEVLEPAGIRRMRLGASLEAGRVAGEVKYYSSNEGSSVFPDQPKKVPEPYGEFCLEAMDSHGGWIASAVDLVRFAAAMGAPGKLLKPELCAQLYEPPAAPVSRKSDGALTSAYYGCGWDVRPIGKQGKANYWHFGSLPGTATLLVRRFDGLSWAIVFNQRSRDAKLPDGAIDSALHRAADSVAEWPKEDLFEHYG
jgi:N-acyl-D-amino-acid deacylase